jgi:hypothetical protein
MKRVLWIFLAVLTCLLVTELLFHRGHQAISPDGRFRASIQDSGRTIVVWDDHAGREILTVNKGAEVLGVHFVQEPRGEGIIYRLKNGSGPFIHILLPNPGVNPDDRERGEEGPRADRGQLLWIGGS